MSGGRLVAPSLTLPRKRERGPAAIAANSSVKLTRVKQDFSTQHSLLSLPLAGEGWGGGLGFSTNAGAIS